MHAGLQSVAGLNGGGGGGPGGALQMQRKKATRSASFVTSPSGITVTSDPPVGSFAMGQFFGQAALPFTGHDRLPGL